MSELPLLGRLALREGLISEAQLEAAVRAQGRSFGQRRLGDILVARGDLDEAGLARLLKIQRESTSDPDALVRRTHAPSVPATLLSDAISVQQMLDTCASRPINDLLLAGGEPVRVRAGGRLDPASPTALEPKTIRTLLGELLTKPHRDQLDQTGCVRFMGTTSAPGRFRAMIYRCEAGLAATFRLLPAGPPTLSALQLPTALARLATFERGLVLVAGGVAAGKTSTAAALVDLVNEDRSELIMTAEQLVEHVHPSKRSVVQQRLRDPSEPLARVFQPAQHRPSVLLIDPLHGGADLQAALRLADMGHLVFAVTRSVDVESTLRWAIRRVDPRARARLRHELGRTLRAVVCQRLLPRVGGGLVPAVEQMIVGDYLADIIRSGRFDEIHSVIQAGESKGMLDLERSLHRLRAQGLVA